MELLEAADQARDLQQYDIAESKYKEAIRTIPILSIDDTESIHFVEIAVLSLVRMYTEQKRPKEIGETLEEMPLLFASIPKAKTAKLIRKIFDSAHSAGMSLEQQQTICGKIIDWARREKRSFLRHRLQHRLAHIQFEAEQYLAVMRTITSLLREVRKLDDKALLVEIHLLESRVHYQLHSPSKARAAHVAAVTNANAIYCPPLLQAELDMQSGVLHMDEKDPKTAYSYFYESFEGYHSVGDHLKETQRALKYMLLCKVVSGTSQEIIAVISMKHVLKYHSRTIDAMRCLANAFNKKDTQEFDAVRKQYAEELDSDPVVGTYLHELYDTLLEDHLVQITRPYSVVQISHIASFVKLDVAIVEAKLSQMILDKKLRNAILDQKQNCLIMQTIVEDATAAEDAFATIENLNRLVEVLYDKVNGNIIPPPAAETTHNVVKKKTEGVKNI